MVAVEPVNESEYFAEPNVPFYLVTVGDLASFFYTMPPYLGRASGVPLERFRQSVDTVEQASMARLILAFIGKQFSWRAPLVAVQAPIADNGRFNCKCQVNANVTAVQGSLSYNFATLALALARCSRGDRGQLLAIHLHDRKRKLPCLKFTSSVFLSICHRRAEIIFKLSTSVLFLPDDNQPLLLK